MKSVPMCTPSARTGLVSDSTLVLTPILGVKEGVLEEADVDDVGGKLVECYLLYKSFPLRQAVSVDLTQLKKM